jgi:hypothetical protein
MKKTCSYPLKLVLVAVFSLFLPSEDGLFAQGLFQLNGNGSQADLGNNCYRLTLPAGNQFGSMWFRKKADLTNDFDVSANLNFGTLDGNGADGIVFAFQDVCTSSGGGGGGIFNSPNSNSSVQQMQWSTNNTSNNRLKRNTSNNTGSTTLSPQVQLGQQFSSGVGGGNVGVGVLYGAQVGSSI